METHTVADIEINEITPKALFFNKRMYLVYVLLAIALFGIWDVFYERYFLVAANAHDAGLNPASRELAHAMKEAVFGAGGEVKREAPWSLYIVNYMYMIYVGSGIIFLVALAELMNVELIKRTATGFLTLGLSMIIAGLFTIMMDLNVLHLYHMFLSPQLSSGMWLMMPLYAVYIPVVMFEIYLLLTKKDCWVKKLAIPILVLSILVELVEFYVQAKLFDMNAARHLWTTYPFLTVYFMVSSFVASAAIMIMYTFFVYRKRDRKNCEKLMALMKQVTLFAVIALGMYEAIAYLFIDRKWGAIILFGDFKYFFYLYLLLAIAIPFFLLLKEVTGSLSKILAAFSIVIGTYIGRIIFVYGGNSYPMSDRFGLGFEKYAEYEPVRELIFFMPPIGEIMVVIGSIGVVLLVYNLAEAFLSVSEMRDQGDGNSCS